jgi:hypothetical protein
MDTKTAREILGCANDNALARELNLTRQAVSRWGGKVPEWRQWQIELLAIKRPATEGGSGSVVSWTQEEHPTNEESIHDNA